MTEHEYEREADAAERELADMEERSRKVGDQIDEARKDWEAKVADPAVPGAAGDPDRAEEGGRHPETAYPAKGGDEDGEPPDQDEAVAGDDEQSSAEGERDQAENEAAEAGEETDRADDEAGDADEATDEADDARHDADDQADEEADRDADETASGDAADEESGGA